MTHPSGPDAAEASPQAHEAPSPHPAPSSAARSKRLGLLTLGALGVVFGDIGTDPLFSLRECFGGAAALSRGDVLGVCSLVFWSLLGIVCIKYLWILFRADHQGEGGILAMLALTQREPGRESRATEPANGIPKWTLLVGLFGAGMLFADAIVTPAISVLSAVEGLRDVEPRLSSAVVPLTTAILIGLFALQKRGTAGIGALFGPVMILWFLAMGVLGALAIATRPEILFALDPRFAVTFLLESGARGFLALGGVVLTIAGAEALYADIGHFGKQPIRIAWYALVAPSLVLIYLGQGALLLQEGRPALDHLFYGLASGASLIPLVLLATAATVIASQSLITGMFSLTEHAMQLGYLPDLRVEHTSSQRQGQIYVPLVNWVLMVGAAGLVLVFQDSARLGPMYGMAVLGTMLMVSFLFYPVARRALGWSRWSAGIAVAIFLIVDGAYLAASVPRLLEGSWIAVLIGVGTLVLMLVWSRGMASLRQRVTAGAKPLANFAADLREVPRTGGSAVFFADRRDVTPTALATLLTLRGGLPGAVLVIDTVTVRVPKVVAPEALDLLDLGNACYQARVHLGYMQRLDVTQVLAACVSRGALVDPGECAFWITRHAVMPNEGPTLRRWQITSWGDALFALLLRRTPPLSATLNLPPERVKEIGVETALSGEGDARIRRF